MKNVFVKCVDKLVSNALKLNINSTTSITAFQPLVPKELNVLSKFKQTDD